MIRESQPSAIQSTISAARRPNEPRVLHGSAMRALLKRCRRETASGSRDHILAPVLQDGIDVRVDWDGLTPGPGRFDVQLTYDTWQSLEHIDTSPENDVISPQADVDAKLLTIRFQRGPDHSTCRFAVKAVAITWTTLPEGTLPYDFVAARNVHYEYENGIEPGAVQWVYSEDTVGVQRATISLNVGRDYELWVRLQDPANSIRWLEQDPIVRTGSGGGNTGESWRGASGHQARKS